jgi:hypothetical protein
VTPVVEVQVFGAQDYSFLATAPAGDGTFSFHTGELNAYNFRMKFVQSMQESAYAYAQGSVVTVDYRTVNLPMVIK